MPTQISDLELFLSLQRGEQEALGPLMERYRRLVFSIAVRKLGDEGEAEDLVQTVFLELYRLRANYNPELGTVRIWLLQLAYRRSVDRFHHLSRSRFFETIDLEQIENLDSGSLCLATWLDNHERVQAAMSELNEAQRRVIHLSHFEGHSMREIAELHGESVGAVRHHFYRGLRKMRVCLEGQA